MMRLGGAGGISRISGNEAEFKSALRPFRDASGGFSCRCSNSGCIDAAPRKRLVGDEEADAVPDRFCVIRHFSDPADELVPEEGSYAEFVFHGE